MAYARHIKNGRVMHYVAVANRNIKRSLRAGLICAACGRKFDAKITRSTIDPTLCTECRASL